MPIPETVGAFAIDALLEGSRDLERRIVLLSPSNDWECRRKANTIRLIATNMPCGSAFRECPFRAVRFVKKNGL